jgi:hypothetical protein
VDDAARLNALRTPQGRALIARLTPWDEATALATIDSARRDPQWADRPHLVAAAATQARLRTRAASRFPGPPRWWTADGLEQATRPEVALRHARRFAGAGVRLVADLGCGAGSDAVALAGAGLDVLAVDRDPAALAALAGSAEDLGLSITLLLADATDPDGWWNGVPPAGAGCFVDPARRRAGSRTLAPHQWSPPWNWVQALAERVPATGAKVAPGIAHAALPPQAQVEWVSVGGDLVEAAAWWGPLRVGPARRQATLLVPGDRDAATHVHTLDDARGVPEPLVGPIGTWLVEPDPSVLRAGLVALLADQLGGHLLDPRIAYVCGHGPVPRTPWAASFEVLEEVPVARKQLRAWLRARGFGDVVVKKRGINVVPEQLRSDLRLSGDGPTATLVLTRTDDGPLALLVRRA